MTRLTGRVLIIGANGQLGQDLLRVLGAASVALDRSRADVRNLESLKDQVRGELAPDWIINCAALTNVDGCEQAAGDAFGVNAVGAHNVARAAQEVGARVVYISTDYVFAGDCPRDDGYRESDSAEPLNVYGASKLAGEMLTRQVLPEALIIRLSSLFGAAGARGKGGNFVETVLRRARAGEPLRIVADQTMTPTYTHDAALAVKGLIELQSSGVIHVANSGWASWHEFASAILERCDIPAEVKPIRLGDWPSPARRPLNSVLRTDRLAETLGTPLPVWHDALERYLFEKKHISG